jgi:CP family cyanate transporter-like MFS transporter
VSSDPASPSDPSTSSDPSSPQAANPPSAPASGATSTGPRRTVGVVLAVVLVVVVSVNLRPGASGVGPLMSRVTGSFGQGAWADGLLTALPCLCFGLIGLCAVPLSRRIGLTGTLAIAFVAAGLGLLLRPRTDVFPLFVLLSVVGLAGPSLANVVAPAWIKRHGGRRTVLLTTLYSVLLGAGATAGSSLAVPMARAGADGWRDSLQTWGLIAVVPAVVAVVALTRTGNDFPPPPVEEHGGSVSRVPLRRSSTAVALTFMFGLQSMNAYAQFGFMPQVFADAGVSAATAGTLTAVIPAWGILGGLVMPTVIARSQNLRVYSMLFGLLTAAGYVGLLIAPAVAPALWASLLGIGGFAFPTAIALIPGRSRDPLVTARLSGMVQPLGYLIAAVGPLVLGVVLDATGSLPLMLVLLLVSGLALAVAGWKASGQRMVDDDLADAVESA